MPESRYRRSPSCFDRHIAAFPKDQHRQILRIGEAELFQQGLIGLGDRVHRRIDGEAELLFELWLYGVFRHASPHINCVLLYCLILNIDAI